MKLSRTDLVPVLAIVAGGVIGASLSFGFLGSGSDDVVFVATPVVAPSMTPEARAEAIDQAESILRMRIEEFGVQEPLETVPYRINFLTSEEMATSITQLISERGQVAEASAANTVIVTDIRPVHEAISDLIGELDVPTPQERLERLEETQRLPQRQQALERARGLTRSRDR